MSRFKKLTENFKERLSEAASKLIEEQKEEILQESLQNLEEARFKIVNRVRNGKVQRRKKVSTQKGYTFRGGKLVKMSASERMRRKVSQRRAAKKRMAKKSRSNLKRKRQNRIRNRTFGKKRR